jgi:Ethanolamine utilisation protein EutA
MLGVEVTRRRAGGMVMHDDLFEHNHITDAEQEELAQYIWRQETVEMNTVGIDIGSSTSHLLFARIRLQREAQALSSRFVVTSREVLWRSPIALTPFLADGAIDVKELGSFIRGAYHQAGIARDDIVERSSLQAKRLSAKMQRRSMSCSPKRPGSLCALRRGISWNAHWQRMAQAR